ncbi:MAG: hypothetical protein NTZ48_05980 [Candidatus Omnitrophica bacterium]|nr:hypothetical protein [Candidatus Omnitrophota bacterium]
MTEEGAGKMEDSAGEFKMVKRPLPIIHIIGLPGAGKTVSRYFPLPLREGIGVG